MEILSESTQGKVAGERLGGGDLWRGQQRSGERAREGRQWERCGQEMRKSCAKSQWGEFPGRSGLTECPILRNLSEIKAETCLLLHLDSGGKMEPCSRVHRLCVQWAKIKADVRGQPEQVSPKYFVG